MPNEEYNRPLKFDLRSLGFFLAVIDPKSLSQMSYWSKSNNKTIKLTGKQNTVQVNFNKFDNCISYK